MDYNKPNHDHLEIKALEVLEAYGITKPVVNVSAIAKKEGYAIKEIKMPVGSENVAGFYDRDRKTIYINAEDAPDKKLFSIAHELGHIFLEHPTYGVLYRIPKKGTEEYPIQESEANSFAAYLLMPRFMVREYLEKYRLSRNDYRTMAEIFGVPMSAMKYQLEYLK